MKVRSKYIRDQSKVRSITSNLNARSQVKWNKQFDAEKWHDMKHEQFGHFGDKNWELWQVVKRWEARSNRMARWWEASEQSDDKKHDCQNKRDIRWEKYTASLSSVTRLKMNKHGQLLKKSIKGKILLTKHGNQAHAIKLCLTILHFGFSLFSRIADPSNMNMQPYYASIPVKICYTFIGLEVCTAFKSLFSAHELDASSGKPISKSVIESCKFTK